jgi:hypothetical protein
MLLYNNLVRIFRSSQFGLYRGQFISRDENNNQSYKILLDDQNIGLINVNDYDVMVEKKEKNLEIKHNLLFEFFSLKNLLNVLALLKN